MQPSPEFDVAVIGAGAAGITVARHLSAAGMNVALIEGGDLDATPESQILYDGEVTGHPYPLTGSRLRFFGGTTNHWHGWCRPLDPLTFQPRPEIDYPGWELPHTALDPYLAPALDILDIPTDTTWEPPAADGTRFTGELGRCDFDEVYWRWSAPTRFKGKYLEDVQNDPNITLLVNQSLVDLDYALSGLVGAVTLRHTETREDRTLTARRYVLACGGIENARLLLHINRTHGIALGGEAVGRHFMEHPHIIGAGELMMMLPDYEHVAVRYNTRTFRMTPEAQLREGLLACSIRLVESERQIEETFEEMRFDLRRTTTLPDDGWRLFRLDLVAEQEPFGNSSVTLSDELDALGVPKPVLYWELTDRDYHSMRRTARLFGEFAARSGVARCRFDPWVFDESMRFDPDFGNHHIGTTRMASRSADGAVDLDCRLHGTDNVYVAGSSVFSTGGYANPTLALVQLALRLADHLTEIGQT